MGKKKYNWKDMNEYEKKMYKKQYMRDYYNRRRRGINKSLQEKENKKKYGFRKTYGTFVVKFQ